MTEENKKFTFGSEALKEELEGTYMKFVKDQGINIEVLEKDFEKRIQEFEDKGEKKIVTKYDISILVGGKEKLWSVSRKVLNTIDDHIVDTHKFKVILREKSFEVIPLGLSE